MAAEAEASRSGNPFLDAPEAKKKTTLKGIYIALIGAVCFMAVISTILPVAALEIGGTDIYAFTSTLNSVGSVVFMPLWGYIVARKPAWKRQLFCGSMVVGVICLLLFATAQSMMLVIVTGPFYGALSAAVFVLSYSMIRDMYDVKQAGLYLGFCGAIMAAGAIIGPLIAGVIIQVAGWRWVCHLFWPIMLVGTMFVWFGLRVPDGQVEYLAHKGGSFDALGMASLGVCLGSVATMLSLGVNYVPFGSAPSNVMIAMAVVAGVLTVFAIKRKGNDAIIPMSAVKDRDTMCFTLANIFTNFSNLAPYFFLPTFVLYVMGASAIEAALTISAFTILSLFLSPLMGKRIGVSGNARGVLILGTVARIVVTLILLVVLVPSANIWVVYAVCLLGGVASGSYGAGLSAGPQIQLKPELRVQGNSVIQTGQAVGNSVGLATYTSIMAIFGVAQGMHIALIVSAAAAVIALLCVLGLSKPHAKG